MINFYKIISYFLSVIIGFFGFIVFTLSIRDLFFLQNNDFGAVFGLILGVVMVVGSYVIYDSLWRF